LIRPIWVIYRNPTDFPNFPFVMRKHYIEGGKLVRSHGRVWRGSDVDRVREHIPKGKTKMERSEKDEPQIVEWWY
jgi:hypothetical protein